MEDKYRFQLIDGEFSPSSAASVVLPLINSKINFHSLEGFSNEIRFNADPSHSKLRIAALKEAQTSIEELLAIATAEGKKLRIKSTIEVEFI